jgi:15-cis-phytoene synthase
MTNILRDIGEDARRDPSYIQLDKMRRFGYSEAELMVGVITDSFRQRYQMIVKGVDGV